MKIEVNGIQLDYKDQGAGLPVVFIHAFPLNQAMWDDQLQEFKKAFRTVTVDLRGFGNSDVPPGPYLMDRMAADVRALMSALEIEEAVLVGLSMGGYVSLAFYRNYPGAVTGMVLADTRAGADSPEARKRRLDSAEKVEREGVSAIADDVIPMLLANSTIEQKPEVVNRVRGIIEANSPAGVAAAQRGMAERPDSTYILTGIDKPILIVVGSEDSLTPVAEAEALRNGIPHSRLTVIKNAGHLTNLEQPAEFNFAVREFLAQFGNPND